MGERKPQYKVCLIGPTQSGKTYYANGLLGLVGRIKYFDHCTTIGVEVYPIEREECIINLWDIGSTIVGLGDKYTIGCNGILQFHDEEDNPPPFEPPQGVPIVHIYVENDRHGALQALIEMMHDR